MYTSPILYSFFGSGRSSQRAECFGGKGCSSVSEYILVTGYKDGGNRETWYNKKTCVTIIDLYQNYFSIIIVLYGTLILTH